MKLILVIPFCKADGALAEHLIDHIFFLSGRQQSGHCLIVPSSDCHAELVTKVQLSAEVTFESVSVFADNSKPEGSKSERINRKFMAAAEYIHKNYRWPFLWLEPDCVPLKPQWLDSLFSAYDTQPKPYLGPVLKYSNPNRRCLARVAIYPSDAIKQLESHCKAGVPFNVAAGDGLLAMSSKSALFQQLDYRSEADVAKIRPDAVLLHSDKKGQLMIALREQIKSAVTPA